MWEEQPEFQKAQASLIGRLVLIAIVLFAGLAVYDRDWNLLKTTLLFAAAFIIAQGILIGVAWLVVKALRLERKSDEQKETPKK